GGWVSWGGWSVMRTMYAFAARAQLWPRCRRERGAILGGRLPLASCAPPRHMCACAPAIPDMSKAAEPAIAVDQLVKVYKTTRAGGGRSFSRERASLTGLLGGNGAGKTTTIAMIMGLV